LLLLIQAKRSTLTRSNIQSHSFSLNACDYRQGLVVTLRDELLAMLIFVVGGKRVNPQRFAKEVLDAVENIPVEKFLAVVAPQT
jgi:hypothetical protein